MRRIAILLSLFCAISTHARADESLLTLFAAASTTDALTEIAKGFEMLGHSRPVLVFGSSATLARQIAHGAPADLYLSANGEWVDYLEAEGLLQKKSRQELLGNSLVVAVPDDSPFVASEINPIDQILFLGRLAMADPASVPAGRYAKEALGTLGLWQSASQQAVIATDVRVALKWIARGEVAGGITYATDAAIEPSVRAIWQIPAGSHARIKYEIARITGKETQVSSLFLDYLKSKEARAVFSRYGFLLPRANGG